PASAQHPSAPRPPPPAPPLFPSTTLFRSAPERHCTEAFAALETGRGAEPAWLAAARKAAIARFAELGVPDRRHEEWKYTNARRIAEVPWRPAGPAEGDAAARAALGLPPAGHPPPVPVHAP